uniref:N-acetyltransferase ESCO2 n=1 Tax=Pogona vitticeps TaxID=103695 RepID=A0ABM5F996_9SAUR
MAGVTPRKRKRSLDGLQFIHGNPVKKLMMDFTEELPVTAEPRCGSSVKQRFGFQEEDKENHYSPQRLTKSQKLDVSPLQTASVPKGIQRISSARMSPEAGATYTSIVPTTSFYSNKKPFLNILERRLANERLSTRKDEGSLPLTNKTETLQVKMKTAGNRCSKTSKRPASFKQASFLPKNTKKAKMEITPPKPVERKENVNFSVEKKMEAPFRVLSRRFKPALKLQTGAAFFATGKKGHSGSKRGIQSPSSLQSVNRLAAQEKQEKNLTCTELVLSAEIKTAGTGKKGSSMAGSKKEEEHKEMGGDETMSSQNLETLCESKQLQNMGLKNSQSTSLKTLAQKETGSGSQDVKNITQRYSRNIDKKDNASSSEIIRGSSLADNIHPLFNTSSGNKQRPQSFQGEQPSLLEVSPIVTNIPTKLKTGKNIKSLSKGLRDQMVIDAGQKHFGATVCKSCGMVYSCANPEDEAHHIQYHQRFLDGIKYVSWSNERVVAQFWDGKIVMIQQGDSKYASKKAEDVRELVDRELGFKQVVLTYPTRTQTYLFVYNEKKIIGCLIAEPVRQAFRVLSEPSRTLESPTKNSLDPQRAWRCSTKPEKVFCGISRIWVFSLMRRKHIASRLVDVVRRTFLFGSYLSTDEIAFSDPTPDGKVFAAKYCQTPNFLVYNFIN